MLVLFRLLFTGLFLGLIARMRQDGPGSVGSDLASAGWLALAILAGIAAACTWAPVLGHAVAAPLSDLHLDGSLSAGRGGLMRAIRWTSRRGWRRTTLGLCFLEGVVHPHLPAHFAVGLEHARPGSWLEKVFAREVYRFSNLPNCLRAHAVLRSNHGLDPGPHSNPEVNLALLNVRREERPSPPPMTLPAAPAPPLPERHPSIRLFHGPGPGVPPVAPGPPPPPES